MKFFHFALDISLQCGYIILNSTNRRKYLKLSRSESEQSGSPAATSSEKRICEKFSGTKSMEKRTSGVNGKSGRPLWSATSVVPR